MNKQINLFTRLLKNKHRLKKYGIRLPFLTENNTSRCCDKNKHLIDNLFFYDKEKNIYCTFHETLETEYFSDIIFICFQHNKVYDATKNDSEIYDFDIDFLSPYEEE
jgi:hypothetical protein